jgi:hypothetical protein
MFTARINDGMGMSDVYISRTDSLLKQTVAFQSSANDMMPLFVSRSFYAICGYS